MPDASAQLAATELGIVSFAGSATVGASPVHATNASPYPMAALSIRTERASALPGGARPGFRAWPLILGICAAIAANWASASPTQLTATDSAFLDDLQRRSMLYFAERTDLDTGLTRDRAPNADADTTAPASISATGFALTAWCIADSRGWLPPGYALDRARVTLRFVADHVEHEGGWFYHFVDAHTGRRAGRSEASTIDTALFLQGALCAREYFRDAETTELVNRIYARVDWTWALNGGKTLTHGWVPERGFIPHRWDSYSEHMGLYLLGIGAPQKALPASTWDAWRRPKAQYAGRTFIRGGPLFTHQYAQAWFDFRGRRDAYADYWQNSIDATLAQRAWFGTQRNRFRHLSEDVWGLTASDSPYGYVAWGTPGHETEYMDGTLVPCAPGGSLPFAPRECLTALERMREIGGNQVWGRYGFSDAFNPETGWKAHDVIGIDVGIMLIQAENLRTGFVWDTFMRAPEVQRGMQLAGFQKVDDRVQTTVAHEPLPDSAHPAKPALAAQ